MTQRARTGGARLGGRLSVAFSVFAGLAACSAQPRSEDGPTGTSAAAIVDGQPSSASQDFVVQIVRQAGLHTAYICSGSLVAPNLVLTARHCVSETADQTFSCMDNGESTEGGDVGVDFDPVVLHVFVGVDQPVNYDSPNAAGTKIFHDQGTTICNHDLALLVIDPPITGVTVAPLNLDTKPKNGDSITSVGWGVIADGGSPTVRQQRSGVAILTVGPGTDPSGYVVGDSEFDVGEDICEGDSGGPALDASNAVIGVVSRGGNGSNSTSMNPAVTCLGPDTANFYTSTAGFEQTILDAFAAAGATPVVVEVPLGQSCTSASQCTSGLCSAIGKAAGEVCTQSCATASCPSGFICDSEAGAVPLCEYTGATGGGCALSGGGGERSSWAWLAALGYVMARRRKR